jgi:hypothetical protein
MLRWDLPKSPTGEAIIEERGHSMDQSISLNELIDSMTTKQAQQAILKFYELMPMKKKPTTVGIEARVVQLQENAPDDTQPLLTRLAVGNENADDELRGTLAKALLHTFNGPDYALFHQSVHDTVEDALKPDMSIILTSIGAYLIVIALIPTKVQISKEKGINLEFDNLKHYATLADDLKEILNKLLPSGLLSSDEKSSNDAKK